VEAVREEEVKLRGVGFDYGGDRICICLDGNDRATAVHGTLQRLVKYIQSQNERRDAVRRVLVAH